MFSANGKCSIHTFTFLKDRLSFPDSKEEIPPIISCVIMNKFGIWWAFSCCCYWECQASWAGLKLSRWSRMTLNVWTYSFHLPSARNPGVHYYSQLYLFLGNEPRTLSFLGQYAISWATSLASWNLKNFLQSWKYFGIVCEISFF